MSPAIRDVQAIDSNSGPFQAWFGLGGKQKYGKSVLSILRNIQDLSSVRLRSPVFVCANMDLKKQHPEIAFDFWWRCNNQKDPDGNLPAALNVIGHRYVALCAKFWSIPPKPDNRNRCLTVTPRNLWYGDQDLLDRYKTYVIAHELVHLYLGMRSMGFSTMPQEVYGIRQCMDLTPANQQRNPQNYQLYFSSKFPLPNTFISRLAE